MSRRLRPGEQNVHGTPEAAQGHDVDVVQLYQDIRAIRTLIDTLLDSDDAELHLRAISILRERLAELEKVAANDLDRRLNL